MPPLRPHAPWVGAAASASRAASAGAPAPPRGHRPPPPPQQSRAPSPLPAAAAPRSRAPSPLPLPAPASPPVRRSLVQRGTPGGCEITLRIGADLWRLRVGSALTAAELEALAGRLEQLVVLAEQAARRRGLVAEVITLGRGEVRVAGGGSAAALVTGSSWPSPSADEQTALAHLREVERLLQGRAALRLARAAIPTPPANKVGPLQGHMQAAPLRRCGRGP